MKRFLISVFVLVGIFSVTSLLRAQEKPAEKPLLIVVDGKISSQEALDSIPQDRIAQMHYLMGRDAQAIYGMAAPHGALLVKTKIVPEPVLFIDGQPVPKDSVNNLHFERVDVIRGPQALNLYGPGAKDGLLMLHSSREAAEKRTDVWLEIRNSRGKPVKGALIKDEKGKTLAISNKCGMAYVENLLRRNIISVVSKKYVTVEIPVQEKKVEIQLNKKSKKKNDQ